MNPCSLVRTINLRFALCHHLSGFIRAIYVFASHGKLPAHLYASSWAHNPVISISLIELRTFCGVVLLSSIKNDARLAYRLGSIGRKLTNSENGIKTGTASCPSIHEITSSVFIPEWTRVYHSFSCYNADGFLPSATWVFGLHHEDAVVWVAPVNVEFAVVVSDGWCPNSLAVLRQVEKFLGFLFLQGMSDNLPVYQVLAMKDRQTWDTIKRTSREIIVFSNSYHVWVAIVGINYGVGISTVAIIGIPDLRMILGLDRHRRCQQDARKEQ